MKKIIFIILMVLFSVPLNAQLKVYSLSIGTENQHPIYTSNHYLPSVHGFSSLGLSYRRFDELYAANGYYDFLKSTYLRSDSISTSLFRLNGLTFYDALDSVITDTIGINPQSIELNGVGYWQTQRFFPLTAGYSWLGTEGRRWSNIYGEQLNAHNIMTNSIFTDHMVSDANNFSLISDVLNIDADSINTEVIQNYTMRFDSSGWKKTHLGFTKASNDTSFAKGATYDPRVLFENTFTGSTPLDTNYTWVKTRGYASSTNFDQKHQRERNRGRLGNKKGMVFFRIDDAGHYGEVANYAELFDNYGNWTWTLNLSISYETIKNHVRDGERERESLQAAIMKGVEWGDHTLNHNPNNAELHHAIPDYDWLTTDDGIDTLITYGDVDTVYFDAHHTLQTTDGWGSVDFAADIVSPNFLISQGNGVFTDLTRNGFVISLGLKTELFRPFSVLNANAADPDTVVLYNRSLTEAINRGSNTNQTYYIGSARSTMGLTVEGTKKSLEGSKLYFDHMGLKPPRIWMQTGAGNGHITADTLLLASEESSIFGARTFSGNAEKTFSNRDATAPFEFEWGDFILLDTFDNAAQAIKIIVDAYARNYAVGNNSHLVNVDTDYYARVDSVLKFCKQNNIRAMSMGDAIEEMYYTEQDPYINMFPNISNDMNVDGIPDGYAVDGSASWNQGTDGLIGSDSTDFSRGSAGNIFTITDLGGIENGYNEFIIWTKGAAGDSISVTFTPEESSPFVVKYAADTADWTRYESGFTPATRVVFNYDDANTDVAIAVSDYSSGTVRVTGIEMRKKR